MHMNFWVEEDEKVNDFMIYIIKRCIYVTFFKKKKIKIEYINTNRLSHQPKECQKGQTKDTTRVQTK